MQSRADTRQPTWPTLSGGRIPTTLTYLIGPMRTGRPSVPYRPDTYRIGRQVPHLQPFIVQAVLERTNNPLYFAAFLATLRGPSWLQGTRVHRWVATHEYRYIQIN